MAIEDARKFVDKAAQDKNLRDEGIERWKEIEKVGAEHGFHFTRPEFEQAEREKVQYKGKPGDKDDPGVNDDTCFCVVM